MKPEGVDKVIVGEGTGDFAADKARSIADAFDKMLGEMDTMISAAEGARDGTAEESATGTSTSKASGEEEETLTDVLPGFPEKIEGEIVFCEFAVCSVQCTCT